MTNRIDCENAQDTRAHIDVDMGNETWTGSEDDWGASSGSFAEYGGTHIMSGPEGAIAQFNSFPVAPRPGNRGGGVKTSSDGDFERGPFTWACTS